MVDDSPDGFKPLHSRTISGAAFRADAHTTAPNSPNPIRDSGGIIAFLSSLSRFAGRSAGFTVLIVLKLPMEPAGICPRGRAPPANRPVLSRGLYAIKRSKNHTPEGAKANMASWTLRPAFGLLLLASITTCANAQRRDVVRSGSFEIGGFAGASYGIDQFRVMGGGNATFAVTKWLLPYVEYSYFPGIGREQSGTFGGNGATYKYTYSVPLSDFHGGVHIRIPIRESPVVPYLVLGFGAVTNGARTEMATYTIPGASSTSQQAVQVLSATNFAVNSGGGIRFYVNQRFGFRVEAKAYRPNGEFSKVFGKVEGGFFFQLR